MNTEVMSTTKEKIIDKLNLMLYFFWRKPNFIILFVKFLKPKEKLMAEIQDALMPFYDSNIEIYFKTNDVANLANTQLKQLNL